MTVLDLESLRQKFIRFSEIESQEMSPFYSYLASRVAKDDSLLGIVASTSVGQPPPNMIFASVRLLLDQGAAPELLAQYPTTFTDPWDEGAYEDFRDFVLKNELEIRTILKSRKVQSNVIRRSAVLLPGLIESSATFGGSPFTNIEIGASAGLTLMWDKFRYKYVDDDDSYELGVSTFPWAVETKIEGRFRQGFFDSELNVTRNIGLELAPISITDQDAVDWLRALIWPEHSDNRELFEAALKTPESLELDVRSGDALVGIGPLVSELPDGEPINVYHSHTLNQFSAEMKQTFTQRLADISVERPVNQLGFEGGKDGFSILSLRLFRDGKIEADRELAHCEAHGRWIKWVG